MSVETFFIIAVNDDGSLTSHTTWPDEPIVGVRLASTQDIYQSSKQIVEEFDAQMLANRIADTVVRKMGAPVNNVSNTIIEALKERGIKPESVTPAE